MWYFRIKNRHRFQFRYLNIPIRRPCERRIDTNPASTNICKNPISLEGRLSEKY